jgi:putative FmdB family regulatory protein
MPTYEYACRSCGRHVEVVQSFRDDPLTTCPHCGGELRKVFSPVGIVFKGSGFYKNDSRDTSKTKAGAGGKAAGSSEGSGTAESGGGSRDGAEGTGGSKGKDATGGGDAGSGAGRSGAGGSGDGGSGAGGSGAGSAGAGGGATKPDRAANAS